MSKELKYGILLGKGSADKLLDALAKALGAEWAAILPYLEGCYDVIPELELVASLAYLRGQDLKLTPPLKARIAACLMRKARLLLSLENLLVSEGERGEESDFE